MTATYKRRLAAIMFTDIAGYTKIMEESEAKASEIRQLHRAGFERNHQKFGGEILQYYGDGTLSIFNSSVEAVECAISMQSEFNRSAKVPLRIGIHMGDISISESDVVGNGVNIASRVESMGIPGAVLISEDIQKQVKNHGIETVSMGHFEMKNVSRAMEVYAVKAADLVIPVANMLKGKLKDGKSEKAIAVLPFSNLSSDPEQEYFNDGLTEEIIADLSQIQDLRVISRTSTMVFKNTQKNLKTIGNELGVQFILEGSVRKAGDRLRITAQLIDATTDQHLWAEKYKGTLEDIFDLQEDVSRQIVSALKIKLTQKESQQMVIRPIDHPEAYDLYLKARSEIYHPSETSLQKAMELIDRASFLIGKNELLLSTKGHIHLAYINLGLIPDQSHANAADKLVEEIFSLNPDSQEGLLLKAMRLIHSPQRQEAALLLKQLLAQNPNHIDALIWFIITSMEAGQPLSTLPYIEHLLSLDPLIGYNYAFLGWYYLTLNDIENSKISYRKGYEMDPNHPFLGFFYASMLPLANEKQQAISILEKAEFFPSKLIIPSLAGFLKYALLGQKEKALNLASPQLKEQASWSSHTCFQMARVYALLREKNEMLSWLEMALEKGFYNDLLIRVYDDFAPYDSDSEFLSVLARIQEQREQFQVGLHK